MKKYLIVIKFDRTEVLRIILGAINRNWAERYGSSIIHNLLKGSLWSDTGHYDLEIDEIAGYVD